MPESSISANPFAVMNVWPTDPRAVLDQALSRAKLLGGAKQAILAHQQLINLGQRIACEVNWFPGVSPEQQELVSRGFSHGQVTRKLLDELPPLARSNLMLALTEIALRDDTTDDATYLTVLLTDVVVAWSDVEPKDVFRVVNKDRESSGFSLVTTEESVREALDAARHQYRIVLRQALMRLSVTEQSDVLEKILRRGVAIPNYRPSPLLIDLVDDFAASAQKDIASSRNVIDDLISEITDHIESGSGQSAVLPAVEDLIEAVYEWDSLMQPVQLARQLQVKKHEPTVELHSKLRATAIRLVNERGFAKLAKRLTDCFADAFQEVREIAETSKTDIEALEKILEQGGPDRFKDAAWRKAITWQSQSRSTHLRISPQGIEYGHKAISLGSISRFRLLRDRSIGLQVSGPSEHLNIYFTNAKTLNAFIDRLVTAVAYDIHYSWHLADSEGRPAKVGPLSVTDEGLVIRKTRIFRGEESYSVPWNRVQLNYGDGGITFRDVQNGRISEFVSYFAVDNAMTLEVLVKRLKSNGMELISDLY